MLLSFLCYVVFWCLFVFVLNVASVSGLSIPDCPFGFLYILFKYIMTSNSLVVETGIPVENHEPSIEGLNDHHIRLYRATVSGVNRHECISR